MKRALRILLFAAAVFAGAHSPADDEPLEVFLKRVREPRTVSTYAKLDGSAEHIRRGSAPFSVPVYFGAVIMPERISGQLILDESEGYIVGQSRETGGDSSTSVMPMREGRSDAAVLDNIGLSAGDFAVDFLYWPAVGEDGSEFIRGMDCRIVKFAKDGGEAARVWISTAYGFPLKAEFFSAGGGKVPYRTLEVSGFKRSGDLWYASEFGIYGPGWRTRIHFTAADVGYVGENPPAVTRALKK